ncbi:MAG: heme ABC transporter permease [Pseudomonadota bacterium]
MIEKYANPQFFEGWARPATPWLAGLAALLGAIGLYFALYASPPDYQQKDSVRIMYVHVPAAWMALFCYTSLTISSIIGFVWKHPLADVAAKSTAPIGAVFTALALVTGALWGKPTWGAYWVWDARLTSVLVLFFLYLGYLAIWQSISDKTRAARIAALTAIVGFVNVPIIKFSVDWWNSLHQPASILRSGGVAIDPSMLTPLLLMATSYLALYGALVLLAMRTELTARRVDRLERLNDAPASEARVL